MKAAPAPTFVVAQAEFLFQLFVIPFDDPAVLGQADQIAKFGAGGHSSTYLVYNTVVLVLANRTSKISLVGRPLLLEVSHETQKLRLPAHALKMRVIAINRI